MVKEIKVVVSSEDIVKETGKAICGMTCSG